MATCDRIVRSRRRGRLERPSLDNHGVSGALAPTARHALAHGRGSVSVATVPLCQSWCFSRCRLRSRGRRRRSAPGAKGRRPWRGQGSVASSRRLRAGPVSPTLAARRLSPSGAPALNLAYPPLPPEGSGACATHAPEKGREPLQAGAPSYRFLATPCSTRKARIASESAFETSEGTDRAFFHAPSGSR
jgi:hypothetical protein